MRCDPGLVAADLRKDDRYSNNACCRGFFAQIILSDYWPSLYAPAEETNLLTGRLASIIREARLAWVITTLGGGQRNRCCRCEVYWQMVAPDLRNKQRYTAVNVPRHATWRHSFPLIRPRNCFPRALPLRAINRAATRFAKRYLHASLTASYRIVCK